MVKVIQNYVLNEAIGVGSFGTVHRATNKTKSGTFAVKVIPVQKFQQNQKLQTYISNQIQALSVIGASDYIIRYYQIIKSKNNYYIVYEYCDGGTLETFLKKEGNLEESEALRIFRQLLQAFKILNKNNIMHRDLKPENIFFNSEGKAKLGDFGFCKGLKPEENLAKTMLGSPIYMAPQILKGESYTTKADIWSLGVILFQMIFGICPFQSKSIAHLISTIDSKPVQFPSQINISSKTRNLIKKMLTKDYFRRMGWVELFSYKISEEGEYLQEQLRGDNASKVYSYPSMGLVPQIQQNQILKNRDISLTDRDNKELMGLQKKQKMDEALNSFSSTRDLQVPRTTSQPKEKKKFYSQKYMNFFSSPLSLDQKISPIKKNIPKQVIEDGELKKENGQNVVKKQFRHERIGSMNIEKNQKTFNSLAKNEELRSGTKRLVLLKKHQKILRILKQVLAKLSTQWESANKGESGLELIQTFLHDSYILLKFVQQRLKEISNSLKTETSIEDMANMIKYQQIQTDRFVVELRNELIRWKANGNFSAILNSQFDEGQNNLQIFMNEGFREIASEYMNRGNE